METNFVATASTTVNAPIAKVFDALIDPAAVKAYMFGATVTSDWRVGSLITWKGEWKGKPFEDKGTVLEIDPPRRPEYSHFSPLSGEPDIPENHHTVTIDLESKADETLVTLTQDNNKTAEAQNHSQKNWEGMLAGLKKYVEAKS